MKIICKQNIGKDVYVNNTIKHPIYIGKEYTVMGFMMPAQINCLHYLIDEDGLPWWCPYFLFEISNNSLPSNWYITILNQDYPGVFYLAGFYELCNNNDYYELLMERDESAMQIYSIRKMEYEKENEY